MDKSNGQMRKCVVVSETPRSLKMNLRHPIHRLCGKKAVMSGKSTRRPRSGPQHGKRQIGADGRDDNEICLTSSLFKVDSSPPLLHRYGYSTSHTQQSAQDFRNPCE